MQAYEPPMIADAGAFGEVTQGNTCGHCNDWWIFGKRDDDGRLELI
jgi:hypothetical protein